MKVEPSRLILRKPIANLELLFYSYEATFSNFDLEFNYYCVIIIFTLRMDIRE